jgi:hypothetical protein
LAHAERNGEPTVRLTQRQPFFSISTIASNYVTTSFPERTTAGGHAQRFDVKNLSRKIAAAYQAKLVLPVWAAW